jgi:hypothetical protein
MKPLLIAPVTFNRFLGVLRDMSKIYLYHLPVDNYARYDRELNKYIRTTYQSNFNKLFPN